MIATSSRWVLVGSIALSLALGSMVGVMVARRCGSAAPAPDDTALRKFAHDLVVRDFAQARVDLAAIAADSIFRPTAQAQYDDAVRTITAELEHRARTLAAAHACERFNEVIAEAVVAGLPDATGMGTCEPAPAPADTACDADALRDTGQDHLQTGMDAAALASFEASMRCRPDAGLLRLAFMAACRSKNAAKAKFYYPKLPTATTTGIVQICVRNGITLP